MTSEWDRIVEGEELPPLTLPVTLRRCVVLAAATRDFYPGHHDRDFARAQGVRDVYVSTIFLHGVVDRVATSWLGPEAVLVRRRMSMHLPICVGDVIEGRGRVTGKSPAAGGRATVDVAVELHTREGRATTAESTFELPTGPA